MKVSLKWAQHYSNVDLKKLSVDQWVEKIGTQLGAVEEVIDIGERYQGIVIAKVVECIKHPNADKLSICKIDDGKKIKGIKRDEKGYFQAVCGAPNVKSGLTVVWLPPGTIVPSTFDNEQFKLEARDIRGETSNGMLASAKELALGDDHSGIAELEEGKPGDDFAKTYALDDFVIDIENKMFTHRPDLFGILGVARELAGITHQAFESPAWYRTPPKLTKDGPNIDIKIENQLSKLVPRFTAVAINISHNGPSPIWLKTYLSRVGLRPINTVVDITNYFMHLTGQPLHAYDYDKLPAPSLETRMSKKGEILKLLNGKEVAFEDDQTILITSGDKAVGVGGVMGGEETEVDENTKRIVLEVANFDMYTIRRTAMQYGLFTDAVTRFNKGQSSLQQDRVLAKAALDVVRLTNGTIASQVIDKHATLEQPKPVRITPEFVNERLGLSLTPKKMAELLQNVEFKVLKAAGKQLAVTPPFWRTDIEIPEDIVEEIGRLYGYDHLPLELPHRDTTPAAKDALLELKNEIRDALSKAGANEVLTYSFVHGELMKKAGQDPKQAFQLNNALSPDLQYYRLSITPSLLEKVHLNVKMGYDQFVLFEIGKAHIIGMNDPKDADVPMEPNCLALVFAGDKMNGAAYYQARVYLDTLLDHFGMLATLEPLADNDLAGKPWLQQLVKPYDPARSALIHDSNGATWGVIGEYTPNVCKQLKLPAAAAGFEIGPFLFMQNRVASKYVPLPRFPRVEQDMTLKVPTNVIYAYIYSLLQEKLGELKPDNTLAKLTPLDIYQKDINNKHFTWRLSLASYERTLTDSEVNKLLDDLAHQAQTTFGAERV